MNKRTRDLIVVLIVSTCFCYSLTVVAALIWASTGNVITRASPVRHSTPPTGGTGLHDPTVLLVGSPHE